jgi:hypothetical protein
MSAPTTAAEVLAAHSCVWSGENVLTCQCGQDWRGGTKAGRGAKHAAHQADALREAGLLVAQIVAETGPGALSGAGAGGNATCVTPGRETGARPRIEVRLSGSWEVDA